MKTLKRVMDHMPWMAILGGTTGLALGWLGHIYAPFDILAHFTPHFIGVLASGILAIILKRHTSAVLTIGALITLGIHPWMAWQPLNSLGIGAAQSAPPASPIYGGSLKILAWNSWHSHPDHAQIISHIRKTGADIVILSEFGPNKRALLNELKKTYPEQSHCAHRWHCSVIVLSKYPGLRRGSGGPTRNIAPYAWTTINLSGRELTIIGSHQYRPIDGPDRHLAEMKGFAELARSFNGAILVAGDFNTTPWADSYRLFKNESGLTPMKEYLPSWPARFPQLAIDHIFHSEQVMVTKVFTAGNQGSDHLPLVAEIKLLD